MRTPAALVAICLIAAGCGGSGSGKPAPIQGPAAEVAAVVERLHTALAAHDFAVVCDELLSSAERRQAGGSECPRLLATTARDLRKPRIAIQTIELSGDRALVKVTTTAEGQAPANGVIRLVRQHGRFRIASLGG